MYADPSGWEISDLALVSPPTRPRSFPLFQRDVDLLLRVQALALDLLLGSRILSHPSLRLSKWSGGYV